MNTGDVWTVTAKGPTVAAGDTPFVAVTEYEKAVIPEGTVPESAPVVALIDTHPGAPETRAKVGAGLPDAVNV